MPCEYMYSGVSPGSTFKSLNKKKKYT